ncbi:MAG TPA: glutamate-cysteine ligase family protein [Flavobacteriaceae bacterium]|nr:glutamate-cysteine ligase family protein [Flavobacteriaceae bacterium]
MKKYHLFEVFGIELEYMLVEKSDWKVSPIVDQLMRAKTGEIVSDVDNGKIAWSNELTAHVVELKTNGPTADLENLDSLFAENIGEINQLLKSLNAKLWPTAAHPLMDPKTEMQLWKHHNSEIYALYNRVFDCCGHGWANVQSMHLNLPFYDDAEFEKLHAAIRLLLPIISALSASSPIFEGKNTGFLDARMEVYKTNQKEIPEMTGKVIPERVYSKEAYSREIFEPINAAVKPYDTEHILDQHFLNSRGAIARFDRNAIEIRVIDVQECPKADIAIAVLIIEVLKMLVNQETVSLENQKFWHENELFEIFNDVIKNAEHTVITDSEYLKLFGFDGKEATAGELWKHVYEKTKTRISPKHQKTLKFLLENGSLASRILKAVNEDFSKENLKNVYDRLGDCLAKNQLFAP